MRLAELLQDVVVEESRGDLATEVNSVSHVSDECVPSSLFCCIPGARSDGHDYVGMASQHGAVALLVERFVECDLPQVRVEHVRMAMGPISAKCQGNPTDKLAVIGVTGTNGKTTTTHLIAAIAAGSGRSAAVLGTLGARVALVDPPAFTEFGTQRIASESFRTTPEAPELQATFNAMLGEGLDVVAMEVSSHALAQGRAQGTKFAVACFTNCTHDHLDYHLTIDEYFAAKASLFDPAYTAACVINVDGERGSELAAIATRRGLAVMKVSCAPAGRVAEVSADLVAENVEFSLNGSKFVLFDRGTGARVQVTSGLVGQFNLENALCAAGCSLLIGCSLDQIATGLAHAPQVPGRMERVEAEREFTVLVDYAHTPDGLAAVLGSLREVLSAGARLIVVFGCGGDRDTAKRAAMGRVAGELADIAILTTDNPRSEEPAEIASQVLAGLTEGATGSGSQFHVELDRRSAITLALGLAGAGDVVIVAGKGHEIGQIVGDVVYPFDDKTVVLEELAHLDRPT